MPPAEVVLGDAVEEARGGRAEHVDKHALRVGPRHPVHPVVHEGEVAARHQGLEGLEVEDGLEEVHVGGGGIHHLDPEPAGEAGNAPPGEVHAGEVGGDLVLADALCALVDGVCQGLGRGAAIFAVVLDAEVVGGAARVVRGGEDEGAVRPPPRAAPLADGGGHGRGGHEGALAHPHRLAPIAGCHLDDHLHGLGGEVPPIARYHQHRALELISGEGIEGGLHKVVEVVGLLEHSDLLAEARGSGLLPLVSLGSLGLNGELASHGRRGY
mmetsp:Transcript_33182/g.105780  ORF Transcript_33182/g.105780 Transcript_33182/m.105780 type:complete len:269 (-) Transcript_33182:98-904(-)